jgi:hypothetical protein
MATNQRHGILGTGLLVPKFYAYNDVKESYGMWICTTNHLKR